jgi:hypothetical protein
MHYEFRFFLAALATWRITHLLAREDGPWNALQKVRRGLESRMLGRVVSCFYCLSVWIAVPFALFLGGSVCERVVGWWALSGISILLERTTQGPLELRVEEDFGVLQPDDRGKANNSTEGH